MNKRGQGLPLNTLIIIILVVIVLIVVAVFFLGGTSNLSKSIRGIFYGTTAGTDLNLAVEQCRSHCGNAQALPDSSLARRNSGYCKQTYSIDKNGDGKITKPEDEPWVRAHCWQEPITITCVGVKENTGGTNCPDTGGMASAGTSAGGNGCVQNGGQCVGSCTEIPGTTLHTALDCSIGKVCCK